LETDTFLKTLCDDIYIANKTAGTPYAAMFTTARQTTQGRQQTYNCSALDELDETPLQQFTSLPSPNLFRPRNIKYSLDLNQDPDSNIDNYMLSHNSLTPYSSDGVISLMREVSGNHSIGIDTETPDKETLTLDLP